MGSFDISVYRRYVAEWHPCSSPFRVRWMHFQGGANWRRLLSSAPTRKLLRFQVSLCGQPGTKTCDCARFPFLLHLPLLVSPLSPPDPIPVLKQGVMHHQKLMQAQDYEIENKQLRETLQEYNSEFAQVESTITVVYSSCLQLRGFPGYLRCLTAHLVLASFPGSCAWN